LYTFSVDLIIFKLTNIFVSIFEFLFPIQIFFIIKEKSFII
jgi:hypothetical protein